MFYYQPDSIPADQAVPLVVVLHGCLQCASSVGKQTGWNQLADEHRFYVLYPQQRIINNPERCFKWYKRKHIYKNRGENASIQTMVTYMKQHYRIDSSRVFITGLSAGAAMTTIMCADYPETYKAGVAFAGAPFKVATSAIPAGMAFFGWRIKSPEKWGSYVLRENPGYQGNYPKMIIYQGNNDWIVNPRNGREIMKQWTNVHKLTTSPSEDNPAFLNLPFLERKAYSAANGDERVVYYKVEGLSHALLVDPGSCAEQGGRKGVFAKDKNFNSTLWAAYDMGLLQMPLIDGPKSTANAGEQLEFSVPDHAGSTYQWSFPADCNFDKTNHTAKVQLSWGATAGAVDVVETDVHNCQHHYKSRWIKLQ